METVYRTILIYFIVLLIVRMMGKREIGQLSPFDFVVAIIIAELAAIPMESTGVPLWQGILPMVTLGVLEIALSYIALHSPFLRRLLDGEAQVVIKNGHILKEELRRARYNLNDLLAQLREKGVVNICDVEFGILETSGKLSVIPKSQKRPVTPEDLGISTVYEGLPTVLVMDGAIMKDNLRQVGLDEEWLLGRLAEAGLHPRRVFLATLGTDGKLFINEDSTCKNREEKTGPATAKRSSKRLRWR
ncbi:DUF421 domain-containing protein [Desulfofundulus thermobenzoicus]|uniref:DUF421 domain-containing protein n=1 Tax=Desulfofundulus thermobenzoicus TaxID=29376 RepID=A0A6N7IUP8_9FIRM|nr:DUF421 domain-containing protein [Desulfofundulus thermobenzoicus]MQL52848.1 DUF421 domain-containing protein [Desulfofundulus thermobenzoicus]HHW45224.1 DUF421 domain-containing protein [Desulfotomaculum sp.]